MADSDSSLPPPSPNLKRKRPSPTDHDTASPAPSPPATTHAKEATKSSKRRKTKKPKDITDDSLSTSLSINTSFAHLAPSDLSTLLASRTTRFNPSLTLLEQDELHIPAPQLWDTTSFSVDRVTEALPRFLESFTLGGGEVLRVCGRDKGAPHTLIIAGAGLRAADLVRVLRVYGSQEDEESVKKMKDKKKGGPIVVAKLFAKHIKLKESEEACKKLRMNIAIGTPQRLQALLDSGALSIKNLRRIVIDASHIDTKKRGILDMKEVQEPLMRLLTREELRRQYADMESEKDEGIRLLFF